GAVRQRQPHIPAIGIMLSYPYRRHSRRLPFHHLRILLTEQPHTDTNHYHRRRRHHPPDPPHNRPPWPGTLQHTLNISSRSSNAIGSPSVASNSSNNDSSSGCSLK